jgi:hypothetical protein
VTDQQLYLAIGIPSILAILGLLVNVSYFVAINGRIGSLEGRLDGRIDSLGARLEARISSLEGKFEILIGKVIDLDNRLVRLEERLKH